MEIGVDTSGKFLTGQSYEATVVAAAIAAEETFEDIGEWIREALARWRMNGKLGELHAKKLRREEKLEVCEMLAERGDVRLATVATDNLSLGSSAALRRLRERQLAKARLARPKTDEGLKRQRALCDLLEDPALSDGEYALAAILPLLSVRAVQQALCFFAADEHRGAMRTFRMRIDEEAAPTMRYGDLSLLPSVGGDDRFSFRTALHWHEPPVHPLIEAARHPDGDGLRPQAFFEDLSWVSSADHPSVQIADIVAWILRRAMTDPDEPQWGAMFALLKPLLAGERGETFDIFTIGGVPSELEAMYRHLRFGEQPSWWLEPAPRLSG